MAYVLVEDFRGGMDVRRLRAAAAPGTLVKLVNGHINRGGEIEERKAFVAKYTLPAGTFAIAAAGGALYVFGSAAAPVSLPAAITYQRLQHPNGLEMTRIRDIEVFAKKLYVVAEYSDGSIHHFYDGTRVDAWADGRARTSFTVTDGSASPGVNKVSSIRVNGVEILGVAVNWTTSHEATAAAIAAQINSYSSAPEYAASSDGPTVNVIANVAGASYNGYICAVAADGDVKVSAPAPLSGGSDSSAFDTPATFAKTVGSKLYAVSGEILAYSKVGDPTTWNGGVGAGFKDLSQYSADATQLLSMETYFGLLAVFARRSVQIWNVNADEASDNLEQVLRNTGTIAEHSVLGFGETDVFYLADTGVRSLRARDTTNSAFVSDVGTAIDEHIQAYIATLTEAQISNATAVIDPLDGRYMLALGERIYVFSFFPNSKISAWGYYEPGFAVDGHGFAVDGKKLYVRSGDTIYLYGGDDGAEYDDNTEVVVELPFLSGSTPATLKNWTGVDVCAQGEWTVEAAADPSQPDVWATLGVVSGVTMSELRVPYMARSSMVALRFTHRAAGQGKLSQIALHYESDEAN